MKKQLLLIAVTATLLLAFAGQSARAFQPSGNTAGNDLWQQDSITAERLLGKAASLPDTANLMIFFARELLDIPYVGHTLDRSDTENMVINLRELDCTTYIETVLALSICAKQGKRGFHDYVAQLRQIRYKQGELSYENRLHYYQWWVCDNQDMGFVRQIDTPNPPFTAVQTLKINYMSTFYDSYDMLRHHPERVASLKVLEDSTNGTRVRYIPTKALKNTKLLRNTIHDGDILALVTTKRELDTSHLGIAVWHDDGLHLLNASLWRGKVIEEPLTLRQYMLRKKTRVGIRVARPSVNER